MLQNGSPIVYAGSGDDNIYTFDLNTNRPLVGQTPYVQI